MLKQTLHQVRTLHTHRVAGRVLDVGGGHQLTTLLDAGDQHRVQIGADSLDGGTVASGT
jgi:hypothetical protein